MYKHKIFSLIILCVLSNFSSGCGWPFIKHEKYEARKIEQKKKKLLKRQQKAAAELKIIDDKLHDTAEQILIFTAKQNPGRVMSIEAREMNIEYKKKVAVAENETKKLQKKYDALESEIKEIEVNLKMLDQPVKNR